MRGGLSRADWLALLALLALDLAAYGALLLPDRMLVDYDAFVYFYPLRAYAAQAVQEGRLPLWNPLTFLGVPFIANPQTAFFYPPTALFFWQPVPQAYGQSLALHALLAGGAFYTFCRATLGVGAPSALLGGATFMLSGVLSGQYGHLNQISAAAWLPLVLLLADRALVRHGVRTAAAAGVVLGLQLLAGHPQQSYMTLVATGLLGLWRAWGGGLIGWVRAGLLLALLTALGAGLAAVQLVPTAELARLSIRGDGLSYRDAVADSLPPWLVARAILPSYANDLGSTELLGYVGIVPLLFAAIALGTVDRRRVALGLALAVPGLALALGGANPLYPLLHAFVPGLGSFRVPARWLLLYTVGVCLLAASGLDWLLARTRTRSSSVPWRRLVGALGCLGALGLAAYLGGTRAHRVLQLTWVAVALIGGFLAAGCALPRWRLAALPLFLLAAGCELWLAGREFPTRTPSPLAAYAQPRDSTLFLQSRLAGERILSIASEEYELKETPDYRERFATLPAEAVDGFLIAAKRNEVLTPNLNLLYRVADVDGYDGGLLPLQRYLALGRLLVPGERLRPDGVLISRMESLPSRRLMDLLNLRLVLAGRAKDLEDGAVRYDRSVLVTLRPGERLDLARVPRRGYTAAGIISSLHGEAVAEGTVVAELELTTAAGMVRVPLIAGRATGPAHPERDVAPATLEVVRPWSWSKEGDDVEYLARVSLPSAELRHLAVLNVSGRVELHLRALSLIDDRAETSTALVLDDALERTEFFDMKVYEYPRVQARVYLVHRADEVDDEAGFALLNSPDFQPRTRAVVEPGAALALSGDGSGDAVRILDDLPEYARVEARSSSPSLLVMSDAYYPGWSVTVDGQPARLLRTDLALRGVALPAGVHEVVFRYTPLSFYLGAAISAITLVMIAALLAWRGRGSTVRGGR